MASGCLHEQGNIELLRDLGWSSLKVKWNGNIPSACTRKAQNGPGGDRVSGESCRLNGDNIAVSCLGESISSGVWMEGMMGIVWMVCWECGGELCSRLCILSQGGEATDGPLKALLRFEKVKTTTFF